MKVCEENTGIQSKPLNVISNYRFFTKADIMLSTGQAEPNVYEGKLPHIPLYFTDKQTYSVAIDNVYVGGVTGVPYTDCEVFMPLGLHTNVSESRHFYTRT